MDDIYGDLENYNDVNLIDELRNENEELKAKVEKYQFDINKLQQDYDHLQEEFKLLQTNYSSLLKTSRAEIERKTQTITNLNQEKDAMVLNSLKNTEKNLLNIKKNLRNGHIRNTRSPKSEDTKNIDVYRNKDENIRSEDKVTTNGSAEESAKLLGDKKRSKLDTFDKNSESKENTPNVESRRPLSIKDRRKSMPCLNKSMYNSDVEYPDSVDECHQIKKDKPREESFKRNYDRNRHKVSETSGIEDKYSSRLESSKESYNRFRMSDERLDRLRANRAKYETSRHRRKSSPECRRLKNHPDDKYQRPEARHRVLETPCPSDARIQNHRRPTERRSNQDRPFGARSKSRHDNRAPKHKLPSDEEPRSKRSRTGSSNRQTERLIEKEQLKNAPVTEEKVLDKKSNAIVSDERATDRLPKDTIVEDRVTSLLSENMHEESCLSPDYVLGENAHVPREIRLMATNQLDDPRLKSSKYKLDSDKKLSTTIGRNIDLKIVDVTNWNIPRIPVPKALQKPPRDEVKLVQELHLPPQYTDEFVKHVYVDIDHPISNLSMSMEEGEIHSEYETSAVTEKDRFFNENARHSHETQHGNVTFKQGEATDKQASFDARPPNLANEVKITDKDENNSFEKNSDSVANTAHKSLTSYKIPKLNKTESLQNKSTEDEIRDVLRESVNQIQSSADESSILSNKETWNSKELKDKSKDSSKDSTGHSKPKIVLKLSELKGYRKLSPREIVACDLELSDETNEFIDMPKRKSKKDKSHYDDKTKAKELNTFEATDNGFDLSKDPVFEKSKKHKTKKKHRKTKGLKSKDFLEGKTEDPINTDNKTEQTVTRSKKDKFSELFGDSISSSLITPEDLGLIAQTKIQPNSCLPIFEDAQDSLDLINNVAEVHDKPPQAQTLSEKITAEIENISNKIEEKSSVQTNEIATNLQEKPEEKINNVESVKDIYENLNLQDKAEDVRTKKNIDNVESIKAIYENLFPGDEDTKDTEVVKTVILASGVQPPVQQQVDTNADVVHSLPNLECSTPLHALATSTPCKPLIDATFKTPIKAVNKVVEEISSCNSSETAERSISSCSTTDQPAISLPEDQPDVRIFVKRRRKVKKSM